MSNEQETNNSVLSYGSDAVKAWERGTKALGTGDQLAVYALAHAWEETVFIAKIMDRKGTVEKEFDFDLQDYVTIEPKNEDGSRNNKETKARTDAVCLQVFGLTSDKVDQGIKQRINRALEVIKFIFGQGYQASDLEISKTGRISVPYKCLNDAPAEDASKNEVKTWAAMQGETVELDGKKGHTIAELQRRAKPKPLRNAGAANPDKGAELRASISFVTATMAHLLAGNADKNVPAPNKEMRKLLFDLNTTLAAYFTADPVETGEFEKKEPQKNTRASKG